MELMQLARGAKITPTALTGITATATSIEYNCKGHNALILYFNLTAGTGTFTVKIQGKSVDGAYIDMYDVNGNLMALAGVTADRAQIFVGIPYDFKIVATEDVDGATVTVSYELLSV